VTSRPAGIGHGKAWRQAGVVLSFAAWLAGWASPSRRGRGVGLVWAVVSCSAGTDLRKEKKNFDLLIYKKKYLCTGQCSSIFIILCFNRNSGKPKPPLNQLVSCFNRKPKRPKEQRQQTERAKTAERRESK
jgi:hypothetical protein